MATGVPTYKVILCGEYGVGKSSIFRRFLDNSFIVNTGPRSTIGLDHFAKIFKMEGKSIKLDLWDTAGIERFATLSSSYFQNAAAAILCYSINDRESFNMLAQHMLEIIMHTETAKIFLCGNKSDLSHNEQISRSDLEDFQLQCDSVISGMFRTSCQNGQGVREMFQEIAGVLLREAELKFDPTKIQPGPFPPEEEQKKCCSNST